MCFTSMKVGISNGDTHGHGGCLMSRMEMNMVNHLWNYIDISDSFLKTHRHLGFSQWSIVDGWSVLFVNVFVALDEDVKQENMGLHRLSMTEKEKSWLDSNHWRKWVENETLWGKYNFSRFNSKENY